MRTEQEKAVNAAYKRLWGARQRLDVLEARSAAGLDLGTGMRPEEVIRLAQIGKFVKQAVYLSISGAPTNDAEEAFSIAHGEISVDIVEIVEGKHTSRFRDELGDLDTELRKTLPPALLTIEEG